MLRPAALAVAALAALSLLRPAAGQEDAAVPPPAAILELVESAPIETTLDHPDLRETQEVWLEVIRGAREALDLAHFYASESPSGKSRLTPVIEAIVDAAGRGVHVRFLADAKFHETYPETLAGLGRLEGIEVRLLSLSEGVQHAKYMVADGEVAFVGSPNFDWRSLEHVHELGVLARVPAVAAALGHIFEMDWRDAGGESSEKSPPSWEEILPARVGGEDGPRVTVVASPLRRLPDEDFWDLPRLVGAIDGAKEEVCVQTLTYRAAMRDGTWFGELETALRRAAARGVRVKLLLSDWAKREGTIEGLKSLQSLPGIEVRLASLPQWSGGFVPHARVAHAKAMVVDGRTAWIGTSNWSGDYFLQSRNVGLVVEGGELPKDVRRFFTTLWSSEYVETVDPCAAYEPPRIGD